MESQCCVISATVENLVVTGIYGKMDGVAVLRDFCDSCKIGGYRYTWYIWENGWRRSAV